MRCIWDYAFNLSSFLEASKKDFEIKSPEFKSLKSASFLSHYRSHFSLCQSSLKQMCFESISDIC